MLERAEAARDASDGAFTLCGQDDVGVAHGNVGIALALHRLGAFTRSAAYARVAAELLDIEQRRHAGQQDTLEERGSWSRGPVGTAMVLQQTSGASCSDFVRSVLAAAPLVVFGARAASLFAGQVGQRLEVDGVAVSCGLVGAPMPHFDPASPAHREAMLLRVRAFSCNYRDKAFVRSLIGSEFVADVVAAGRDVQPQRTDGVQHAATPGAAPRLERDGDVRRFERVPRHAGRAPSA